MIKKPCCRDKGFTTIELAIAVVVLGILAAVASVGYSTFLRKSRTAEAILTVNNIGKLEVVHMHENGYFRGARAFPNNNREWNSWARGEKIQFDGSVYESQLGSNLLVENAYSHFIFVTYAGNYNSNGQLYTPETGRGYRNLDVVNTRRSIFAEAEGGGAQCFSRGGDPMRIRDIGINGNPDGKYSYFTTVGYANLVGMRNRGTSRRSQDLCTYILHKGEYNADGTADVKLSNPAVFYLE